MTGIIQNRGPQPSAIPTPRRPAVGTARRRGPQSFAIPAIPRRPAVGTARGLRLSRFARLFTRDRTQGSVPVRLLAPYFFDGYILELTPDECSRSQIVTLNGRRGSNLKYLPHAFTERGLYMLATVLKSPRAIAATHAIIETYAQVRELKRELVKLHTESDKKKRTSLMSHFGNLLTDIVMPDLSTAETESSLELNFFIGKLKHTVRKVRRAEEVK